MNFLITSQDSEIICNFYLSEQEFPEIIVML